MSVKNGHHNHKEAEEGGEVQQRVAKDDKLGRARARARARHLDKVVQCQVEKLVGEMYEFTLLLVGEMLMLQFAGY